MKFEELDHELCLYLLNTQFVGRLGVSGTGEQHIFPVNYRLAGEAIVFRTNEGTKLDASASQPVAFEIDHYDRWERAGWSVVVHGTARDITDAPDAASARLRALEIQPWAPGPKARCVVIDNHRVTGRRITWDDSESRSA